VLTTPRVPRKPLNLLARPEGFEPPTPTFVALYSIQLSYGRALGKLVTPPSGHLLKTPRFWGPRY
jgi:hypothetical protein